MMAQTALYEGTVVHRRFSPKEHRLRYDVFSLLLDLDELTALDRDLSGFAYNRWAPMAFHDSDHGPLDGSPLRPWVEQQIREAGISSSCEKIFLLCYPRLFGYVFNPLSVFFCYGDSGNLVAILYEVCNTFSERHTYVIPVETGNSEVVRQSCPKKLYVSPFIDVEGKYRFSIVPPSDVVRLAIRHEVDEKLLLAASFNGSMRPFTTASVWRCLSLFPLQSLKIITAIHFEALKMWLRGFPVFSHSPAEKRAVASHYSSNSR